MGYHLLKSVILRATAQCAVFSGDPSLKEEAQMAIVFYEAAEIILAQVENKSLFTLKLIPLMPKYLIFRLIWSSAALC